MVQPSRTPIRQPWRLSDRGRRWFDVVLVVLLLLPLPAFVLSGFPPSDLLFGAAEVAPLLWRRRHALMVFTVVAAASALQAALTDAPIWGQLAFPVALYSVARYTSGRSGLAALATGLAAAGVASYDWVHNWFDDDGVDPSRNAYLSYFVTIAVIVVAAWALGTLGRTREAYVAALLERNDQLHREADQQAALAAAAERTRIAREMHDVVAHGLSVIVVQADGARYAAEHDPAIASTTLGTIAETAREALTEMRRTLGLLRADDAAQTRPQPRLDDLTALIAETRAAGTPVEAELPPPAVGLPDGVALTAYRLVQEALSNVRKHAGPQATAYVRVSVGDATADDVTVEITDDGRGAAAASDGAGLGLLGMRERVSAHDGELETGPLPGGGFRVWARICR